MLATQSSFESLEKQFSQVSVRRQSQPKLSAQWLMVNGKLECRWLES